MSTREEVAALMANSDPEAKISLLKKAVVTVTRQKQALEQQNEQLQQQMASIGEELARVQEENKILQRKLNVVEIEAERKNKQAAAASKIPWKGLSSLVSGADGADGLLSSKKGTTNAASPLGINLSPEDQEKIVLENENVHKQLFELQSNYEADKRQWEQQCTDHKTELQALQAEVMELRGVVDDTKQAHEQLSGDHITQKALVYFCHHFFTVSQFTAQHPHYRNLGSLAIVPSLKWEPRATVPHEISEELAKGTVKATVDSIRRLMEGISTLIVSLRDSLGSKLTLTTPSNIRCYKDRLITLLNVHFERKDSFLRSAEELEDVLVSNMSEDAMTKLLLIQDRLLYDFERWLTLLLDHTRLLVNTCFMMGDADKGGDIDAGECNVVEKMTLSLMEALATVRGIVHSVRLICSDSQHVMRQLCCDSREWMVALQRFLWEGCDASFHLQNAMSNVAESLDTLVSSISPSPLRAAIQYVIDFFKCFTGRRCYRHEQRGYTVDHNTYSSHDASFIVEQQQEQSTNVQTTETMCDKSELLQALYSIDRAAVCYHTQMNYTLIELATKASIIDNSKMEIKQLQSLQQQHTEETERMRNALQDQIRLLSEKLVEYTTKESQYFNPS